MTRAGRSRPVHWDSRLVLIAPFVPGQFGLRNNCWSGLFTDLLYKTSATLHPFLCLKHFHSARTTVLFTAADKGCGGLQCVIYFLPGGKKDSQTIRRFVAFVADEISRQTPYSFVKSRRAETDAWIWTPFLRVVE